MAPAPNSDPAAEGERRSLVDEAYAALKESIRNMVFAPGYQGSEQEIALQLGMSRTPVHEAIIRLQEEGMVRVLPKRGVLICPLAPQDMREIYDVTIAVEAMAAELLAELPVETRKATCLELERATAAMEQALSRDDLRSWAAADDTFHHILVEHCGNRRLSRIAQTIADQAHRARMLTLTLRAKPVRSQAAHRAIIKAIRSGDADKAHAAARAHRVAARDELLPLIEKIGLRHI